MTDAPAVSALPCAFCEPSFTDGVPVFAHPETGELSSYPYSRWPRVAQNTLKLGSFGDYLDSEGESNVE